jgi:hypothetical protein
MAVETELDPTSTVPELTEQIQEVLGSRTGRATWAPR